MRTSARAAVLAVAALALPTATAHANVQALSSSATAWQLDAGTHGELRATWLEPLGTSRHPSDALVEATAGTASPTFGPGRTRVRISDTYDNIDDHTVNWAADAHGGQVVVWDHLSSRTSRFGVRFSIARPRRLGTRPRLLSTPGASAKLSAVAGDAAGDTIACWWQHARRVRRWTPRCAIRRAGRLRFAPARDLSSLSSPELVPEPFVLRMSDRGRMLVSTEHIGHQILVVQGSLDRGWGARSVIARDPHKVFEIGFGSRGQTAYDVSLAPEGGATVAASENRAGVSEAKVDVVRLSADGAVTARQLVGGIERTVSEGNLPTVATLSDGVPMVAFPTPPYLLATRAPAGLAAPFAAPLAVGAAGADDANAQVVAGPAGSAALTWTIATETDPAGNVQRRVVQLARYDGSSWSAPVAVSDPARLGEHPVVALTGGGVAAVVWAEQYGGRLFARILG